LIDKLKVFIDSNIPTYASGKDHPNKEISINFLNEVSEGKISGLTSVEVMQEILYRYYSINNFSKGLEVFEYFSQIVDEILPVNIQIVNISKDLLHKYHLQGLLPRDSIHAATIAYYNLNYIATFDRHFEMLKNIKYYL